VVSDQWSAKPKPVSLATDHSQLLAMQHRSTILHPCPWFRRLPGFTDH
jgi:hypothetical protein